MNLFTQQLETDTKSKSKDIPVFNIDAKEFELLQVPDLLKGFETLKCVTFSSSLKQMIKVLIDYSFKNVELIIGLSEDYKELTALSDISQSIELLIKDINIDIYKAKNTHTKLYLLSNNEGKHRVITGSANLSQIAWSGKQNEIFLYSNDKDIYQQFTALYDDIRQNSICLLPDKEIKSIKKETENKLKVSVKIDNIENVSVDKMDDKTLKMLMDSTNKIENVVVSNLLLNISINKPMLKETISDMERDRKFLNKIDLLSENEKLIRLKGANAIPEILNENKKDNNEENEMINQHFLPYRVFYNNSKFTINKVSDVKEIDESMVRKEIEALSNILSSVAKYNPEITPYIMEAIMYSFAGSYIWYLRKHSEIEKTSLPIFGFLAGMSMAGKSLTLRLISKMTKAIFYEDSMIENRGKVVDAYFSKGEDVFGVNPFVLDEIKLDAIRGISSALHTRIKAMTNGGNSGIDGLKYGVFIGAFNLEHGNLQLELLRRIFFIPFKKPLKKELREYITKYINDLDYFTYLSFLSNLKLESLLERENIDKIAKDILYPVRSFFKMLSKKFNINLPLSDTYLGSYERFMKDEWKLYYLTHKDVFIPFDYKGRPSYRVPKEKFLVALNEFVVNSSGKYFIVDKENFLKAIGENYNLFNKLTSFFKVR